MVIRYITPTIEQPTKSWCPRCHKTTLWTGQIWATINKDAQQRVLIGRWGICQQCGHTPYDWEK